MVNKFGVHVGVGEVCAASGPAARKTAIASVTVRIATVRPCISFRFRADDVSEAAASVKFPSRVNSSREDSHADAKILEGTEMNVACSLASREYDLPDVVFSESEFVKKTSLE